MNSSEIKLLCNQAVALYQAGRLGEAEQLYIQVLARDPGNVEAHYNRGITLIGLGRPADALASFERALTLAPGLAAAHALRGEALKAMGRREESLAAFDRAVALNPALVAAWSSRGIVLQDLKRLDEALASVDKAISLQPDNADAWNKRGVMLQGLARTVEALASIDKAVSLQPHDANAWYNRAVLLLGLKRMVEALAAVDKAIALQPDNADAWYNRSVALLDLKRFDEALASVYNANALQPHNAEAWNNRGRALWELKRLGEAAISYGKALAIEPDYEFLFGHYLHAKMMVCDWDRLDDNIGKCAAAIRAGKKIIAPFPLLALVDDPALHKMAARIYAKAKYPGSSVLGPPPRHGGGEKLRIGYYSADFHGHATSHLMAELLEAHDDTRFELYGFSFGPDRQDEMRRRISAIFHKFEDIRGMSDRDVARLSRECAIDIAVDLKGYTQDARPGIFAEGCAPLQVHYLGYPSTMSADTMDYVVADRTVIPPGSQNDYLEKIVWLPHSYQANDSRRKISGKTLTRQEAGLPTSGFVFCCFNNNYKILPETFASWMRILTAVNGSVLWLLEDSPLAAKNLREQAAAKGVDAGRLVFAGRLPMDEHLARQRLADLFLDTWPCNAHTTASDALWAGLPVLTCMGKSFASRVAASLLNAVGLPDLITRSKEDYEALAIALASHPEKLANLRKRLEDNRATAPLFDGKLTARHLEKAYEAIHARYQAGLPPDDIEISS